MSRKFIDLTNRQVGKLLVLEHLGIINGNRRWMCRCECGTIKSCLAANLLNETIKSCGCGSTRQDITSKVFNFLTVISLSKSHGAGRSRVWNCRCVCGNIITASSSQLKQGYKRDCGCKKREEKERLIGQIFGRLKVTGLSPWDGQGRQLYECSCLCGNIKLVAKKDLTSGNIRSCGCLVGENRRGDPGSSAIAQLYASYKTDARRRGLDFLLGKQKVLDIALQPCNYCGITSSRLISGSKTKDGKSNELICNGLDRVDNAKGYSEDNIVPCCAMCNKAKYTFHVEIFKDWIIRAAKHLVETKQIILK